MKPLAFIVGLIAGFVWMTREKEYVSAAGDEWEYDGPVLLGPGVITIYPSNASATFKDSDSITYTYALKLTQ